MTDKTKTVFGTYFYFYIQIQFFIIQAVYYPIGLADIILL
ncbi:hypothetical protein L323_00060 [Ruminiclostridium papyrosolvens C7]|uniref:Uncharacterized protein n=1 Tax=Ruminiclostridium papyrosolvens C7 TaxID=1330534 RepID=U4R7H7_9FIRM|nr:hypothetical protein L323_00060 [Ruminiclostridium papyrosolvens C7]